MIAAPISKTQAGDLASLCCLARNPCGYASNCRARGALGYYRRAVTNHNPAAQRRFTRLQVPGKVVALDDDGNELGQISEVSGGGAQLTLSPDMAADKFITGTRVHLSIVENGNIAEQLWMEVRYVDGNKVGLKFLGHK